MNSRATESSSDFHLKRPFVPPHGKEEELLVRHISDIGRRYNRTGQAFFSSFLSDREQALADYALRVLKIDDNDFSFSGLFERCERKILVLGDTHGEMPPLCLLKIQICEPVRNRLTHREYLGALMSLQLERNCFGDIFAFHEPNEYAVAAVLEDKAELVIELLTGVSHYSVLVNRMDDPFAFTLPEPERKTGTVSSLRLDAVLSEMFNMGRAAAAQLVQSGRVEINHIEQSNVHAPVYENDVFSVRGFGKACLFCIPGLSKKGRVIIEYGLYDS